MKWAKNAWEILKRSVFQYGAGSNFTYAAAIAFYTMLSLAPLLFLTVQLAALFTSSDAAIQEIVGQTRRLMGSESASTVRDVLSSASGDYGSSWMSILGIVLSLIGATTVLMQLQNALNEIWDVVPNPDTNMFRAVLLKRLVSLALLSAVGFLLLVSLIADAALAALKAWFDNRLAEMSIPPWAMDLSQQTISLILFTTVFALLFRLLPDVRLNFRDVAFGAVVTAILFAIGKTLIGLYIGTAAVGSAYGAAGSLAALLTWVYYASALVLFGAEITRARAVQFNHTVTPDDEMHFTPSSSLNDDEEMNATV